MVGRVKEPPGGASPRLGTSGWVVAVVPCPCEYGEGRCEYEECRVVGLDFRERSARGLVFGFHVVRGSFKSGGRARRRTPFAGYTGGMGTGLRAVVWHGCERRCSTPARHLAPRLVLRCFIVFRGLRVRRAWSIVGPFFCPAFSRLLPRRCFCLSCLAHAGKRREFFLSAALRSRRMRQLVALALLRSRPG